MNGFATLRASRKGRVALGLGAAVASLTIFGGAAPATAASAPAPGAAASTTGGGTTLVEVGCAPDAITVKPADLGAGGEKTGDNPQCKGIASAIIGTWVSKDCETASPDLTRRRTYVFGRHGIKQQPSARGVPAVITYDLYAGAGCNENAKLFTINTTGNAAFVGPSATVPGASNVLFTFKSRAATPTAAGVGVLQSACPQYHWAAGVSEDLTKDGCGALVQSDTECPVEYDLAAIISGVAYFGDRSHPLCTEATRPTKLAEWGVVKKHSRAL
jgi:hypothetical protein